MNPTFQTSEQIRIALSSVIVASFIAAMQIKDTLTHYASPSIVNLGLSLLCVSAIFSFIFILCAGLEKRFNRSSRLPALAFLEGSLHKKLLSSVKTRAYDFSINVYILAPIIIFSFIILKNSSMLGLAPGPGDPRGGVLYLFSFVMGIMVWNLIGTILSLIMQIIDFIVQHPRLRVFVWTVVIIVFSQGVFVMQDNRSLGDVQWGLMLGILVIAAIILAILPWIEEMNKKS